MFERPTRTDLRYLMGCFLACFGSSKDRKHRKRRHKVQPPVHKNSSHNPVQSTVSSVVQEYSEKPEIPVSEVGVKAEQQLSPVARKKVTFDSNVKTYEHVFPEEEVADNLPEDSEEGKKEKEESSVKSNLSQSSSEASSITSSGSYPANHRYQNCRESDDEEELDYVDSDLDDEDEDGELDFDDVYEDDNDGIVESRIAGRKVDSKEVDSSMVTSGFNEGGKPVMVNRAARDRSAYVHSVLNPVENLTQWKALKAKGKPQFKQQKENSTVDQESQRASFNLEPSFQELSLSFKSKSDKPSKRANQEIAVDASLSNWLSSSETTPINKGSNTVSISTTPEKIISQGSSNSVRSQDDRPILGALTLEEIKQFSASNSPRKSPSRSPDEMPIIGTVGTYWSPTSSSAKDSSSASSYKGIPNTTSKYREVLRFKK